MKPRASLFRELKRRNVFNVAMAYLIASWLLAQVADLLLEHYGAPVWTMKALLIALAAGFPVALLVSWIFEVTSRGVIAESKIDRTVSVGDQSGERLNRIIVVILAIIIVFMGLERFVFSGHWNGQRHLQPQEIAPVPETGVQKGDHPDEVRPEPSMAKQPGAG